MNHPSAESIQTLSQRQPSRLLLFTLDKIRQIACASPSKPNQPSPCLHQLQTSCPYHVHVMSRTVLLPNQIPHLQALESLPASGTILAGRRSTFFHHLSAHFPSPAHASAKVGV